MRILKRERELTVVTNDDAESVEVVADGMVDPFSSLGNDEIPLVAEYP